MKAAPASHASAPVESPAAARRTPTHAPMHKAITNPEAQTAGSCRANGCAALNTRASVPWRASRAPSADHTSRGQIHANGSSHSRAIGSGTNARSRKSRHQHPEGGRGDPPAPGLGRNIGPCAGGDGALLIDDQFAPLSENIQAAVAKVSLQGVRFLLNTHWHGDHTGGPDDANLNHVRQASLSFVSVVCQQPLSLLTRSVPSNVRHHRRREAPSACMPLLGPALLTGVT